MNKFKDHIATLSGELKQAADSNDMRLVHEVQQKLARSVDEGDLGDGGAEAAESAKGKASGKAEARAGH